MHIQHSRSIATKWSSNPNSALYVYATTGVIKVGLAQEIRNCCTKAGKNSRAELYQLYVDTAPKLTLESIKNTKEFWHRYISDDKGFPLKCYKNGGLLTWPLRPTEFRQPVKTQTREFFLIPENISSWCESL
jgi:hypothetical protein